MELFEDADIDQERESREASGRTETRQSRAKSGSSRSRKMGKSRKKRTVARKAAGRGRAARRARTPVIPSQPAFGRVRRPEPPSMIPQPSLDADDEEPTPDEGEQRLEPPAPSASATVGDDDDLFEYVI